MIRFKLKVTNKNKNTVERIQDYTFEPEMFLQGLIKAFVLLDKRYYLIEYQNSPKNMMMGFILHHLLECIEAIF